MLSPPTIVQPVTPCMSQIRLRGQLPDSRVKVFDDQGTVVAAGVAKETEDLVRLSPGVSLQAGQQLRAEQETADDRSDPPAGAGRLGVAAQPGSVDRVRTLHLAERGVPGRDRLPHRWPRAAG